ncbi:MAG TPA: hypothetical protein VFX97_10200 [Pyrinomonadaceae bacterium]|nr:hypothetical protein [Pyrinomonadaceae bacterium]
MFALSFEKDPAKTLARSPATCANDCKSSAQPNQAWQTLATDVRALKAPGCSCRASSPETASPETLMGGDDYHREHQCLSMPDSDKPKRKPFTEREKTRAMFGLINAKAIASRAYMNLGNRDPYHLKKAETAFGKPVSFETLDKHVALIRSTLDRVVIDKNLLAATCDEEKCNTGLKNAVAITLDDLSAIVLCPFFFVQPGRTLATTILHEAGHMAHIDVHFEPGKEQYCSGGDNINCGDICPITGEDLLENVDAWMRFIYCVAMSS